MKNILSFFTIVLISVIQFSCSDQEDEQNDYHFGKISSGLYPMLFTDGSYWVYEKQGEAFMDSLSITNVDIDTFELGPSHSGSGPQGEEQYYNISYLSSQTGAYDEQLVGYIISRGFIYGGCVYWSDHQIGSEYLNAKISDIYDSFNVNGTNYSNVVKMEITHDTYLENDMNLYYADSVGVIKKEIKDNESILETWNLLRYDVTLLDIN